MSQISAVWVLALLSGVRAKRFVWFITAAFLAATVANVTILPLTGTVTAVEQISTAWGEQIAALHREGQSRWFVVLYALAFSVKIFGFVCARHLWSRDRIGSGLLAVASCAIIVGLLNGARVDATGSQSSVYGRDAVPGLGAAVCHTDRA